jgi:hypothetical protein
MKCNITRMMTNSYLNSCVPAVLGSPLVRVPIARCRVKAMAETRCLTRAGPLAIGLDRSASPAFIDYQHTLGDDEVNSVLVRVISDAVGAVLTDPVRTDVR